MALFNCRPTDGTSLNSAGDSYSSTHEFEDFDFIVSVLDVRVQNNAAVISVKQQGASSYGDDMHLPTGMHSLSYAPDGAEGVRIKNAVTGNTAKYQFTAFPGSD